MGTMLGRYEIDCFGKRENCLRDIISFTEVLLSAVNILFAIDNFLHFYIDY